MACIHRHRRMAAYYDSKEFYDRWHSHETIEDIAADLDRVPAAIWNAAKRRGFADKQKSRPEGFRYKERVK